ncbi:MAG: homoserine O-acetyltransferase [Deltaproteobacteria bacterium]|jgi:homoserine O-acetyltransferase|nr:MAG: homoserine O-acetyltransferase [Deltaproteobacteria bacterium]
MSYKEFGEAPVIIVDKGSVGIVETRYYTFAHPPNKFILDNGKTLGPITVAYETYGRLNPQRDNVILVEHALTASAHAAGKHHPEDKYPGWWDVMIGPGKAFDTTKYFVICSNILGSCYGTTGPSSINPETGRPYGLSFPMISIRDMVRVQRELVKHLGIKRIRSVVGGSMGGMQAIEWALLYPEMVDSIILIASAARTSPQSIAIHRVGIQAIMDDPNWNNGDYYGKAPPEKGLAIARMLGHITYLSDKWLWEKFGRKHTDPATMKLNLNSKFEIESYLEYQGTKFVKRFDANSYIYLLRSIDIYDAAEGYGSLKESFKRIRCKRVFVSSFSSDWLYPTYQSEEIVEALEANNIDVVYHEIKSPYGHDSFLLEYEILTPLITDFLNSI